jgi:hypothetical protein
LPDLVGKIPKQMFLKKIMREQNLGKLNFTLKFNLQLTPITTIKT